MIVVTNLINNSNLLAFSSILNLESLIVFIYIIVKLFDYLFFVNSATVN